MAQVVESFLKFRSRLSQVREESDGWMLAVCDFDPKEPELTDLITRLYEEGVISELKRGGQRIFLPALGNAGTLELRIDPGNLPGYFENYDSLIKSYPDAAPETFVVWEKNDSFHAGYLAVCKLLQFLKAKAEVWDATGQRFFLVDQQALEIPLAYSAKQTASVPVRFAAVTRFLDSHHLDADARWAFFRKVSLRLLREVPKEKRLGTMLESLDRLLERAQQNHSLYLERFSFEDLLKNFDEKRLKFVADLNQILSSIQTALIGVPIGFFIILEKFKMAKGWIGLNILLAVGGILFFALLFVLTLNQGKALQGIEIALSDFEFDQKKRVTDKFERLQRLLASTWAQFHRVGRLLCVVRILLILFSVLLLAALLWCSMPSWQRFLPYTVVTP